MFGSNICRFSFPHPQKNVDRNNDKKTAEYLSFYYHNEINIIMFLLLAIVNFLAGKLTP